MSWDRVATLLQVIQGAAACGPKYQYILTAADAELTALMNKVPPPDPVYPVPVDLPPPGIGPGPMGVPTPPEPEEAA